MSDDNWRGGSDANPDDDFEDFGELRFSEEENEEEQAPLSFDDDNTGPLPHWTVKPTSELPRLFPEETTRDVSREVQRDVQRLQTTACGFEPRFATSAPQRSARPGSEQGPRQHWRNPQRGERATLRPPWRVDRATRIWILPLCSARTRRWSGAARRS